MAVAVEAKSPRQIDSEPRSSQNLDATQQNVQPKRQLRWQDFPFLHIFVTNLPKDVTTLDLYNNFSGYGNVTRISIYDHRQDDRGSRAEIRFEPPPEQAIWDLNSGVLFRSKTVTARVRVQIAKQQPRNFEVESPVRKGHSYAEKTQLLGTSLCFGVMLDPKTVMTMTRRGNVTENIRLVLDLRHREIHIFFPSVITSENRRSSRDFRFTIAFDENFTIWKLPESEYLLDLAYIPWYSKQLKEFIAHTHVPDAKRWAVEDTWARQTDIVARKVDMQLLSQTPVALQKNFNNINIARWTTFKIKLTRSEENLAAEKIFQSALKDFNVNIMDGRDIKTVEAVPHIDTSTWNLINGNSKSQNGLSAVGEHHALPFSVRYQLEVCISHRWLSEYNITKAYLQTLATMDPVTAVEMLKKVDSSQERLWDPMNMFTDLRFRRPKKLTKLPRNCMEIRAATITATGILFHTPTVEVTNRIIRKYRDHADRFLRVRFEDDSYRGRSTLYPTPNNKMIQLFQRVKRVLRYGITLGDVHYDFLAWGNSQLREHGVYCFASVGRISAASIRAEMGAFHHEKVVAKRAARMGQCFSTTRPVYLRIPTVTKMSTIPDIRQGKYIYTDGVGKVSDLTAKLVYHELGGKGDAPCTFQFRLGGCKGVLVAWPGLTGIDVKVRESQFKFDSSSGDLEIIRWSEFWQPFLNRQLIICLSDLGVPDRVFLQKQNDTIQALEAAMHNDAAALKALRDNVDPNLMTISMCELVNAGFRKSREPFVVALLQLWRAWSLKYLKEKAKIPVSKGAFVLGVADETGTLRGYYNAASTVDDETVENKAKGLAEIFIQILNPQTGCREVKTGLCVLARNPSLHRGDIRVVKAVDNPALRHLYDVVVMPTNGDRDLPSMCSGGDLDGDDYIVIWDPDLLPQEWNADPFHYNAPPPRTAADEITTDHIIDFFYDYMQNDYLGRIAHAHLAAADSLDDGIRSSTCLDLVHLHSVAVDYAKTGVPAIMERRFDRTQWPHFMEKKGRPYRSIKILGQLYDAVERVNFNPKYNTPLDERILKASRLPESTMEGIKALKREYDDSLQRIMAQHNIRTEFEVWSTFVLDHSKASRDFKFHEEIGRLSTGLKEQFYDALVSLAGNKDFEHLAPIAMAAYQYTDAQIQTGLREIRQGKRIAGVEGMPFISFPWLLQDTLCKIAKNADNSATNSTTVIIRDGTVMFEKPGLVFDDNGNAQVEVVDELEVSFGASSIIPSRMPDPYKPEQKQPELDESNIYKGLELLGTGNQVFQDNMGNPQIEKSAEIACQTENSKRVDDENILIDLEPQQLKPTAAFTRSQVIPSSHNPKETTGEQCAKAFQNQDQVEIGDHKEDRMIKAHASATPSYNAQHSRQDHENPIRAPFAYLREQLDTPGPGFGFHRPRSGHPDLIRKWIDDVEIQPEETDETLLDRQSGLGLEGIANQEGRRDSLMAQTFESNIVTTDAILQQVQQEPQTTAISPRAIPAMGDPLDLTDTEIKNSFSANMELED